MGCWMSWCLCLKWELCALTESKPCAKNWCFFLVKALEGEEKGGPIPSNQPSWESPVETWDLGFLIVSYRDIW